MIQPISPPRQTIGVRYPFDIGGINYLRSHLRSVRGVVCALLLITPAGISYLHVLTHKHIGIEHTV